MKPPRPQPSATVKAVQQALLAAGLDPGPVDGIPGLRTAGAVREWQRSIGENPDGIADEALLERLTAATADGASAEKAASPAADAFDPQPAQALDAQVSDLPESSDPPAGAVEATSWGVALPPPPGAAAPAGRETEFGSAPPAKRDPPPRPDRSRTDPTVEGLPWRERTPPPAGIEPADVFAERVRRSLGLVGPPMQLSPVAGPTGSGDHGTGTDGVAAAGTRGGDGDGRQEAATRPGR